MDDEVEEIEDENTSNFTSGLLKMFSSLLLNGEKNIILTGSFPFESKDLKKLLSSFHNVIIDEQFEDENPDYIIIGIKDFDEDLLEESIENYGMKVKYIPQEAIVDEILFGFDWYDNPNCLFECAEYHPGLKFLKTCSGFYWPSTDAPESDGANIESMGELAHESDLKKLGYDTYKRDYDRERILRNLAIPQMGLKKVVELIAWFVKQRKRQVGGREKYKRAISIWERDLKWLKDNFYQSEFYWPKYEP